MLLRPAHALLVDYSPPNADILLIHTVDRFSSSITVQNSLAVFLSFPQDYLTLLMTRRYIVPHLHFYKGFMLLLLLLVLAYSYIGFRNLLTKPEARKQGHTMLRIAYACCHAYQYYMYMYKGSP